MSDEFKNNNEEGFFQKIDTNNLNEENTHNETPESVNEGSFTNQISVNEGSFTNQISVNEGSFTSKVPVSANQQNDNFNSQYSTYGESKDAIKAKFQAEKEKAKLEKKHTKLEKKAEKKAQKKAKIKENGHGIVFKSTCFVVSAVAFGVISLTTLYFGGEALGIFNNKSNDKVATVGSTQVGNNDTSKEDSTSTILTSDKTATSGEIMVSDVSSIVDKVMPSIVAITSKQKVQMGMDDWYNYYFGFGNGNGGNNDGTYEQTGAGSGIIIGQNDSELLIITNNHVVDGADTLQVQFIDEKTVDATIKGTNSANDLAIVAIPLSSIEKSTLEEIKVATIGNSDNLKVGEGAIAIGNALGYGQSVTTGVISALNREVNIEDSSMTLIQTDAAINPGNSGGALLNMKGEVIGINAAKYSSDSVEGMGFAIPITNVSEIIDKLMTKETLTKVDEKNKGYLNIYGRDVTSDLAEMYSVPEGVYIIQVIEGGAAQKAGLDKSDVITKVNDDEVSSMEELQNLLNYYEKGSKVTLTIKYLDKKEYKEKEVEVELGGQME